MINKQEKTEDAIMKVLLVNDYLRYIDSEMEHIEYKEHHYTAWQLSQLMDEYAEEDNPEWHVLAIWLCEKANLDIGFQEEMKKNE
jgi:hypothetical protein